ncbi:terpene synthase family protein [Nocardia huaxiensis]|uniref:Terpene synthase n=1 Tax=Nocardia huaxiensis TaxID=2755382 RepID=A0A7D6VDH6_9NOCA|nr:terpene synthase family protein [Nocardia huaxiensis]QLY30317.1 terpene synthase [Nocardia huaxiensis]UFS96049.1 terpene synthase family protein [Nocardia huaxiensis]
MVSEHTSAVEDGIERMRAEYRALLRSDRRWSLRELFSAPGADIAEYCRAFRPNRFGEAACAAVEQFCRRHSLWLDAGGAHYNSMTPYLHPGAITVERMTAIGIYNAILFWLNDTVGREKFGHLSRSGQRAAGVAVERMVRLLETRAAPDDPTPLEAACGEYLAMMTGLAQPEWLERFLTQTVEHLLPAIQDQNARARGSLLDVDEYIELRAHVSGMYPAIALCEFGQDSYLDWADIESAGLADELRRLRVLTVDIGALMNDVFSFEKECITDLADFNLIPLWLLNHPGTDLVQAIEGAAAIVRDRLTEFRTLHERVLADCDRLRANAPESAKTIALHAADLADCVQATWVWQITTQRYKGESIFIENCLVRA